MSQEEYFEYIDRNESVKEFLKNFGGELTYNINYGFVYVYGKKLYSLMFNDFEKDIKKSIEKNENLLMKYPEIK